MPWYTLADYATVAGWYTLGGDDWYTLADYARYTLADGARYIIVRSLTGRTQDLDAGELTPAEPIEAWFTFAEWEPAGAAEYRRALAAKRRD